MNSPRHQCARFDSCNAPICPLDPDYHTRTHNDGEAICFYMSEAVKPHGEECLRRAIGGKATEAVGCAVEWAKLSHGPIKKRLHRASNTASRLGGGHE